MQSDKTASEDLTHVLLTAAAYRQSSIFRAAVQLDVFSAIDHAGKATAAELARRLEVSERGIERLLLGLAGLKLLERDQESFRNTAAGRAYLVKGSSLYLGEGMIRLQDIGLSTWSTLTEAVRTGHPLARQRTDEPEAEFWKTLTAAIRPMSAPVAESVCKLLRNRGLRVERMLDLAGGSAVFGLAFLREFRDAEVTQVDWPHVNESAREYIDRHGFGDRFVTLSSDLFAGAWADQTYDVIILSHLLHQESPERCRELLATARRATRPGGVVIVNEYCRGDDRSGPLYGHMFSLNMLLQNHGGDAFTLSEYAEFMTSAGYVVDMMYSPLPPSTILVGRVAESAPASIAKPPPTRATRFVTRDFADTAWDRGDRTAREARLLGLFQEQARWAVATTPFWRERIPAELLSATTPTRQLVEATPLLFKKQMRALGAYDLCASAEGPFHMARGTGGTTGKPVPIFWTQADWAAAHQTVTRFMAPVRELLPLRVWNGYHQGHISGPAFDDLVRIAGGTPLPRSFNSTDAQALEEMERLRPNVLVLTPRGGSGKGGSLEDFLNLDPDLLRRLKIKGLMVSSTPLTEDLVTEVREQGVEVIVNFYGTTEAFPTAASCEIDPTTFHLCPGHTLVEVVDPKGCQVESGQKGMIVVSRIGASPATGIGPSQASQLLRLVVGDSATFIDEPCACGRNTPRIRDLSRVLDVEEKLAGGCERWE